MGLPLPHRPLLARVLRATALPAPPAQDQVWSLPHLAGRLVELSAGSGAAGAEAAQLTAAFGLVLDAQLSGEGAAWITLEQSSFFPVDVAEGGVDLAALPVVRVADVRMAGRAADHLVRCGGFGLVVIDLSSQIAGQIKAPINAGPEKSPANLLPVPLLTRLLGLARQQNVAVVFLTRNASRNASLHPLISLRVEAQRQRHVGRYQLSVHALKDKRGGEPWTHVEPCRGPTGLR